MLGAVDQVPSAETVTSWAPLGLPYLTACRALPDYPLRPSCYVVSATERPECSITIRPLQTTKIIDGRLLDPAGQTQAGQDSFELRSTLEPISALLQRWGRLSRLCDAYSGPLFPSAGCSPGGINRQSDDLRQTQYLKNNMRHLASIGTGKTFSFIALCWTLPRSRRTLDLLARKSGRYARECAGRLLGFSRSQARRLRKAVYAILRLGAIGLRKHGEDPELVHAVSLVYVRVALTGSATRNAPPVAA